MTDGQYRALVAYLSFWTVRYSGFDLNYAMRDIGIIQSREDTIAELSRSGWHFNEKSGLLEPDETIAEDQVGDAIQGNEEV